MAGRGKGNHILIVEEESGQPALFDRQVSKNRQDSFTGS
jgi:hypothetical protein